MRIGGACAHFGCHPYRLHQFLTCRAFAHRCFGVTADAVGALRDMGDSDGDQLLGLGCQRASGEDLSTECLECVVRLRRKPLVRVG